MGLLLTRRTVLARDQRTCQYCGTQPGKTYLTVDHVIPRSKGGLTVWDNVVTACAACNQRKGNRTPGDASMTLHSKPARPRYIAVVLLGYGSAPHVWHKYYKPHRFALRKRLRAIIGVCTQRSAYAKK